MNENRTLAEGRIREVLNATSQENASNTPDFILAQYLMACLDAFNVAVQQRETWYGRDAQPAAPGVKFNLPEPPVEQKACRNCESVHDDGTPCAKWRKTCRTCCAAWGYCSCRSSNGFNPKPPVAAKKERILLCFKCADGQHCDGGMSQCNCSCTPPTVPAREEVMDYEERAARFADDVCMNWGDGLLRERALAFGRACAADAFEQAAVTSWNLIEGTMRSRPQDALTELKLTFEAKAAALSAEPEGKEKKA